MNHYYKINNIINKNKGITIISLVITIIVILIIAITSINYVDQTIDNAKSKTLRAELQMVQHATLEQYSKYTITKSSSELFGEELTDEQMSTIFSNNGISISLENYKGKYYKLTPTVLKNIGIENTKDTYIINYITGEVLNYTTPKTSTGELLYLSIEE